MRIAIMADIHGNLPAFEAALAHCRLQSPDLLVIAGDVVNGSPDSAACWELAKSLDAPIIRGNHERYVAHFGSEHAPPEWSTNRFAPVRWSAAQFSYEERQTLASLPLDWSHPELPGIYFCHSSQTGDSDLIAAYTSEVELDARFPGVTAPLIVRGHNHAPAVRLWRASTIVTTGSVGLTLDGIPTAQYLLLSQDPQGWQIEHQSAAYNIEATLARYHETGYLRDAGPMARLFYREVATASFHIVPFMRMYAKWSANDKISLDDAVERFLGL